jgi:hypothetical protein
LLIQGGTISSGRLRTVAVEGAYCRSCMRSFWKITLPGVVARLRPTANIDASDWRILRSPPPASMSSASMRMPRTRLSALLSSVSRSSSGLVSTKFDGDNALAICRT